MVKIYGSSDDLIEIEGDIVEEFNHMDGEETFLAFSDGTVLSVEYTNAGIWRINRVKEGVASYKKVEATSPDDEYSDCVTLGAGDQTGRGTVKFLWAVQGKMVVLRRMK